MNMTEHLCCFAMRQVVGEGGEAAVRLLGDHFNDRSQALQRALLRSNERAWHALEIALAGEGLLGWFSKAEDRGLRDQMRRFIDSVPLPPETATRPRLKSLILAEVRDARAKNFLTGKLEPQELARETGAFARYSDPQEVLAAEKKLLLSMARTMKQAGYEKLAWLLAQPAHASESVVVAAAKYYFRREVERDEKLAHSLQLSALEGLASTQQSSFAGIEGLLVQQADRLDQALAAVSAQLLAAIGEVKEQVAATGQALGAQIEEVRSLQAQVLELIQKLDMKNQPLRSGHSLSIHNDREKAAVKEMLRRFRGLSPSEQDANPTLMNELGKLQVAAGDFGGARDMFVKCAAVTRDAAGRAEAHHNAYRAALEQDDKEQALRELLQAMALDPGRFAPFPLEDYEAIRILGAGGFGVTILARDRFSKGHVAIKSIFTEDLDRDAGQVLEEATTLDHIKHRSIIGLRRCGYVDRQSMRRPYLVMEYFAGGTLEEQVKTSGPLAFEAALDLAMRMAEALEAAHGMKVLHRDIKPANVLVRREGSSWEVRIIDFGLAMKAERLDATSTLRQSKTMMGASIAGTLGFAAPEQMGKLPGVRVGPQADVYGFGKTLAFALFGITEPGLQHYRKLPEAFAELLSRCMAHTPQERPRGFAEVIAELRRCQAPPAPAPRPVEMAILVDEVQPVRAQLAPEPPRRRYEEEEEDEPRRRTRTGTGSGSIGFASRLVHAILAFFFGVFGVHKFAQGNASAGVIRLVLIFTCIGFYVNIIIGWIEAVVYLTRSDENYYQVYYRDMQSWF